MSDVIWNKEPPTQSGWYWYKSAHGRISMVYLRHGDFITSLVQCTIKNPEGVLATDFKGTWSLEIIPPTEPGY